MNNFCFFCESYANFVCLCYKKTLLCDKHKYYCEDESSYHELVSISSNLSSIQIYLDEWIKNLGFAQNQIKNNYEEFSTKMTLLKSEVNQKVLNQHQLYHQIYNKSKNSEQANLIRPLNLTSKLLINELNHINLNSFINQDILYDLTQDDSIILSEEFLNYEYQILSQRFENFDSKLNFFLEGFYLEYNLKHSHIIEKLQKLNEINTLRYYMQVDLKLLFKISIYRPVFNYFKPDFYNLETLRHHKPFCKVLKQDLSLDFISQKFNSIYNLNSSSEIAKDFNQACESKAVGKVLKFIMKILRMNEYENFFIKHKKEIEVYDIRNSLEFRYILISKI